MEYKISDGDVKGAVKILSSMEALAPQNEETLNRLKLKHPPPTTELRLPDPPDATSCVGKRSFQENWQFL